MPEHQNSTKNLFTVSDSVIVQNEEYYEALLHRPGIRMERIVSTGQVTPENHWYDQSEDEWVTLLQGEATLLFEDGNTLKLLPGDHLMIPAHCKHRVTYTSAQPPAIWLAIFLTASHHDQ